MLGDTPCHLPQDSKCLCSNSVRRYWKKKHGATFRFFVSEKFADFNFLLTSSFLTFHGIFIVKILQIIQGGKPPVLSSLSSLHSISGYPSYPSYPFIRTGGTSNSIYNNRLETPTFRSKRRISLAVTNLYKPPPKTNTSPLKTNRHIIYIYMPPKKESLYGFKDRYHPSFYFSVGAIGFQAKVISCGNH